MKLQTQVPLEKSENQIDYKSRLLLLGSCFSENMGRKFDYFKFHQFQNPFGILFHPVAIKNLLDRSIRKKGYTEEEIFFLNDRWQCFDAHSDLNSDDPASLLKKLNRGLQSTYENLQNTSHVFITLGTAWVYHNLDADRVVANCHKVPQSEFSKHLLSVDKVSQCLRRILQLVQSVNPNAKVIFTVSPVRHLKDGFVENQRSKAHLISAVHDVLHEGALYFPSYEIQMDELRDYRFYKEDMVHPNQLAITYIWEKFKDVYISEDVFKIMDEVDSIQKGLLHRPFQPDSVLHRKFLRNLENKIERLQNQFPFMSF